MASNEAQTSPILKTSMVAKATLDPFLYCVYHKDLYPAAKDDTMEAPREGDGQDFNPIAPYRMYHGKRVPGFPKHPHRGFETITATVEGLIDHSDSLGNGGRYGNGDLQWMTAGKGVVHAEMFPLIHNEPQQDNHSRFFQIWINLPARSKMVEPSFAMFWSNTIPKWAATDGLARATVYVGDYFLTFHEDENDNDGTTTRNKNPNQPPKDSWACTPENDVAVIHMTIFPGGSLPLAKARGGASVNRALYLVDGSSSGFTINDLKARGKMITVDASMDLILSNKSDNIDAPPLEMLLLQGKPIGEPVTQSGPFVMNTEDEVVQADADYRGTEFGGWPWPRRDMIFPREKGRFSLLNGVETVPDEE